MFQMFGFGGSRCPRCEHKNAGGAGYCTACGITLGAPRSKPVLVENRWVAGPDELAVFFGVNALSGLFVKTLRVPATARAYILQGDQATEEPQGEYEIEGFFTRLNHLLRDQHAEILITRTAALPVEFAFDDLETVEHLAVAARFSVSLRVENVPAFARHFMTMPGVVGSAQLRELLAPAVRQLALEFVGAQSLREMAANRALRAQFDERLQGALRLRRIHGNGACFDQVRQGRRQFTPRCAHGLQHAAQRMTRTLPGPAAQLLAPPRQLGVRRHRVAGDVEDVVELLQQREPRHHQGALGFGDERLGHLPFRPAGPPFVEEAVEGGGGGHQGIPWGARIDQRSIPTSVV